MIVDGGILQTITKNQLDLTFSFDKTSFTYNYQNNT